MINRADPIGLRQRDALIFGDRDKDTLRKTADDVWEGSKSSAVAGR
jgi:hypothetical protein